MLIISLENNIVTEYKYLVTEYKYLYFMIEYKNKSTEMCWSPLTILQLIENQKSMSQFKKIYYQIWIHIFRSGRKSFGIMLNWIISNLRRSFLSDVNNELLLRINLSFGSHIFHSFFLPNGWPFYRISFFAYIEKDIHYSFFRKLQIMTAISQFFQFSLI